MALAPNALYQGDCIERLAQLDAGSVDLAFADPPFNIGYEYDVYDDRKPYEHYLDWSRQWMGGVARALSPTGTFWLAIGDEYAAELKLIAQNDLKLTCRSWVIWYYTFGVNCTRKFNRSHVHLFHFVKDPKRFTFNYKEPAIRVPSARQLVYADARANPDGRLPDDTWILRPQDVPDGFGKGQDTWYFPRVAGTFKERAGFHGCQMPEQLLGRIIRASSNEGDLVLDPFGGSGTTLVVAKKLARRWIGFELSKEYATKIEARLNVVDKGDPLDGAADPLNSAPRTPVVAGEKQRCQRPAKADDQQRPSASEHATVQRTRAGVRRSRMPSDDDGLISAYLNSRDGHASDCMLADPDLNAAFLDACCKAGVEGSPVEWNRRLLRLRKAGKLPRFEGRRQRVLTGSDMDTFSFASEIALSILTNGDKEVTLDDVLCDPKLVRKFDRLAKGFSPGRTVFEYRWAAFDIRKRRGDWRKRATEAYSDLVKKRLSPQSFPLADVSVGSSAGIYLLRDTGGRPVYLGEAQDLGARLRRQCELKDSPSWSVYGLHDVRIARFPEATKLRALQVVMIGNYCPTLNLLNLALTRSTAA